MGSVPRPGPVLDEEKNENLVDYGRKRIGLTSILVGFNFLVFVLVLGLAGLAFNSHFDVSNDLGGVTLEMINFSLVSGVVGIASVISASHYLYFEREEYKGISAGLALIAWSLVILSFGMACKNLDLGYVITQKSKALVAFDVIAVMSQSLLVLVLYDQL